MTTFLQIFFQFLLGSGRIDTAVWMLTKRMEKKLDGNYTRMLRAILNKSWQQHPTRHQLYGHLLPIMKTIQVWRTWYVGHCCRSRDELISDVLLWTATYGRAKAGRPARTYIQYIQQLCDDTVVALKTWRRRWTIGRSGERGSEVSVLAARHDDDDDYVLDTNPCFGGTLSVKVIIIVNLIGDTSSNLVVSCLNFFGKAWIYIFSHLFFVYNFPKNISLTVNAKHQSFVRTVLKSQTVLFNL